MPKGVIKLFLDSWNEKRGDTPGFMFEHLDCRFNNLEDSQKAELNWHFENNLYHLRLLKCDMLVLDDS